MTLSKATPLSTFLASTASACVAFTASTATAQTPGFYYISALGGQGQEVTKPYGIGPGATVYGTNDYFRNNGNFRRAFVWSPTTSTDPLSGTQSSGTASGVYGVSADGTVIVGILGVVPGALGSNAQVFRRVNGGPNEFLPLAPGMTHPIITALSADGTTTVGYVNGYGGGGRAVTWTGTSTAVMLPNLPGEANAQALGVSADGSVVVGWSGQGYGGSNIPVRWVNGQVESLGLPPECNWGWASGVADDGNTIIGWGWVVGGASRAWRWTPQDGMTLLSPDWAEARSISGDGRTIAGRSAAGSVVWHDGTRLDVQSLIPAATDLSPFTGLTGASIVSHDGLVLASSERVTEVPGDAEYHAWAVVLPEWTTTGCDSIDFNADSLFPDTTDIDDFLSVFSGGPCSTPSCGDIDFNNDSLFPDTLDIDSLLSVFSGGQCL